MIGVKKVAKLLFVINSICILSVFAKNYTQEECAAIQKFRDSIPDILAEDDYYQNDHFLIRWLRARNMDVSSATTMIRKTLKWRRDNRIDSILNEPSPLQFSTLPFEHHGKDKEGRPILLLVPPALDLRGLLVSGKRAKAMRTWDRVLEKTYSLVRNATINGVRMTNGEDITQIIAILDAHGFNRRQHLCIQCIEFVYEMLEHYENYYPDSLKYFIFINVSRAALPLADFVRPVLSKATRKSVKSFGPNREEWRKFLHSIIDEEQLPFRFGGAKKEST